MALESKSGGSIKVTTSFSKIRKKGQGYQINQKNNTEETQPNNLPILAPPLYKKGYIDKNAQTVANWP